MQLRPYRPDDLAGVVRLSLRAWAPVFASIEQTMNAEVYAAMHPDWRVDQTDAVTAVCSDGANKVWVAQAAGAIAGFVAARAHSEGIGEIYMLAVDPDHQRRGIAMALTEIALAWMKSEKLPVAMVETGGDPGHAPARQA